MVISFDLPHLPFLFFGFSNAEPCQSLCRKQLTIVYRHQIQYRTGFQKKKYLGRLNYIHHHLSILEGLIVKMKISVKCVALDRLLID